MQLIKRRGKGGRGSNWRDFTPAPPGEDLAVWRLQHSEIRVQEANRGKPEWTFEFREILTGRGKWKSFWKQEFSEPSFKSSRRPGCWTALILSVFPAAVAVSTRILCFFSNQLQSSGRRHFPRRQTPGRERVCLCERVGRWVCGGACADLPLS